VDIVNLMLHSLCVELNCHYFFSFVVFLLVPVLFTCATMAYYMVNKDEYIVPTRYTCSTKLISLPVLYLFSAISCQFMVPTI